MTQEAVRFVAMILGREKVEVAIDPLIAWSNHPSRDLRGEIVRALGNLKSERAVEPLIARLEDINAAVRRMAVEALSCRFDDKDRRLLSRDFDGFRPFLDPCQTISAVWIDQAARVINLAPEAVRARYEAFAPQFKLRLSWK